MPVDSLIFSGREIGRSNLRFPFPIFFAIVSNQTINIGIGGCRISRVACAVVIPTRVLVFGR